MTATGPTLVGPAPASMLPADHPLHDVADKVARGERLSEADGLVLATSEDLPALGLLAHTVRIRLHDDAVAHRNLQSRGTYVSLQLKASARRLRFFCGRSLLGNDDGANEGNVKHPDASPPCRATVWGRIITTFGSPEFYCQGGCGTRPHPGGSFLAVLRTRWPAVCGRHSASVCGCFLRAA